jgi:hypothetical protein
METYELQQLLYSMHFGKRTPIDAENKQLSLNAEQDNRLSMRLAKDAEKTINGD